MVIEIYGYTVYLDMSDLAVPDLQGSPTVLVPPRALFANLPATGLRMAERGLAINNVRIGQPTDGFSGLLCVCVLKFSDPDQDELLQAEKLS
jgi:hypothetical protein